MATHIKSIIQNFLKNTRNNIQDKTKIEQVIDNNLDKKLKKHIYLKQIYKNTIIFGSESPSVSYVFNLKKQDLLKAIKKELPQIDDVKITIG